MIDKFNFYDIYGYFLPGASLLLLLWLPFGIVRHLWPASDWGSAVIGIVLAYITGYILQTICTRAMPSSIAIGADGHPRYPSDVVVDKANDTFSVDFKEKLETRIKEYFGLDIGIEKPENKALDVVRRDALFLARHVLIRAKEVNYAEQFEGLYTLARGLAAGLTIGCVNYIGWSISVVHEWLLDSVAIVVLVLSLLAADNFAAQILRKDLEKNYKVQKWLELLSALALLLAALSVGYGMGRRYEITAAQAGKFALLAMVTLLGALRAYSAYKSFSIHFAKRIWQDFFAATSKQAGAGKQDE